MKIILQHKYNNWKLGISIQKTNYLSVETCNIELDNNAITPRKYLIIISDTIVKYSKEVVKAIMQARRVNGNLKEVFLGQKIRKHRKFNNRVVKSRPVNRKDIIGSRLRVQTWQKDKLGQLKRTCRE